MCIFALPGGLTHSAVQISAAVTGVRDLQQILVIFEDLNGGSKTKKHFVIMFNPLAKTASREEDLTHGVSI